MFNTNKIKEFKDNPKKLWGVLKSLYKSKKDNQGVIYFKNIRAKGDEDTAIKFNEYFTSAVEAIFNEITSAYTMEELID